MLPFSIRATLFAGCVLLAGFYLGQGQPFGFVCLAAALVLVFGYLRFGTVWLAFRAAGKGQLDRSERILAQTWFPAWLERTHRSYYCWLKGLFEARRQRWPTARQFFQTALEIGPRTTTDRALLLGILAYACAAGGDFASARQHLAEARTLDPTPATTRLLNQYEQEIETAAQATPSSGVE